MDTLLFDGYEFLSGFIPFLIFFCIYVYLQKTKGFPISFSSHLMITVFAIYFIGVYHFTGVVTLEEISRFTSSFFEDRINLIPFSNEIFLIGYLLNIILFIPLGFFIPLLWSKLNNLLYILAIGLLFSLFIETNQLFNFRSTDIDDLILNTVGAGIGFLLYRFFDMITRSHFQRDDIPTTVLPICIFVTYIGRFFFFREMGLAKLVYGW